jgi:hypothetical protein
MAKEAGMGASWCLRSRMGEKEQGPCHVGIYLPGPLGNTMDEYIHTHRRQNRPAGCKNDAPAGNRARVSAATTQCSNH